MLSISKLSWMILISGMLWVAAAATSMDEGFAAQQSSDEPLKSFDGLNEKDREWLLAEKAKGESGSIAVYSFMRGSNVDFLLGEFRKKYPFVKKTQHWPGRGTDIWRKIGLEANAGRVQADVAIGGSLELPLAREQGLPMRYLSPHRKAYPSMFNDPHNYWLGLAVSGLVMAYNEHRVKGMKPPQGFMDLLHEQWSGKISIDTEPDELVSGMLKAWGPERTEKYFTRLMELKPNIRRGRTLQLELLCAGEFAVGIELYPHTVADYIYNKGCPAKIVYPEFMPVKTGALSLVKNSPDPHTAALFFDWLASKEGAEVFIKTQRISARSDVEPLYPALRGILQKTEVIDILNVDEKFTKEVYDFMRKHIQRRR